MGLANLNELRHLKIQFFDKNNQLRDQTSSDLSILNIPPKWFISVMEDFSTILPEKKININRRGKDLGDILINPELSFLSNKNIDSDEFLIRFMRAWLISLRSKLKNISPSGISNFISIDSNVIFWRSTACFIVSHMS